MRLTPTQRQTLSIYMLLGELDHHQGNSEVDMASEVPSSNISTSGVNNTVEEPQASQIFRVVFFSLTTAASLLGNSIMLKATREHPTRKPVSYLLVTNLAAAELLNTLCLPFSFAYIYLKHWPFGEVACKLTIPLQVLSLFVVTSTLAAIAGYRFFFLAYKHTASVHSRRLVYIFLALVWLTAFVVALPLFIFNKPVVREKVIRCSPAGFSGRKVYKIVRFILNFGLPYLIMILSYAAVAYKLKKHIEHRTPETTEMEETTKKTEVEAANATKAKRGKSCRTIEDLENDLLKMIYVVIIAFALCYLPYQMYYIAFIFKVFSRFPELRRYADIIEQYCFILTGLSSALHPICYGTMSKFYARVFSKLMLCRCNSPE